MSEKKLFHQNIVLNIAKNRCKSAQTITHLEHYMSEKKLFHQNIVLNIAKNRCKSAQTITKCWSISLKFGLRITCHILNLTA